MEFEEFEKREYLEEQIKFYEKEFNINPLSWGKKEEEKMIKLKELLKLRSVGYYKTKDEIKDQNIKRE